MKGWIRMMKMSNNELKHDYIRVKDSKGFSYGGNQNWFEKGTLCNYGCGLVAIGDIILYLSKTPGMFKKNIYKDFSNKVFFEREEYLGYLKKLSRGNFYVPGFSHGMMAPLIAAGFNIFAMTHGSGARAFWGTMRHKIHNQIESMLKDDIPVLFSVGINFPFIWRNDGLQLYINTGTRESLKLEKSGTVLRHYMVITALTEDKSYGELMRVSSWGREYYVLWSDYELYLKKKSNIVFSNILCIRK